MDPFTLPLVVTSTSAMFDIDSTKAGAAKFVDESVRTPSETATDNAWSGVTTAIVSAIIFVLSVGL